MTNRIVLPDHGVFDAFAVIVDINGFTAMVTRDLCNTRAQFTRDVLCGGIAAVEKAGGDVLAFMGDAFLAMLADEESVFLACCGIAKDLNAQCEYITDAASESEGGWDMAPKGPSLKVAVEFGQIDAAEIWSRKLGTQQLYIGEAINYASRISAAGEGNRCLIGPVAAVKIMETGYTLEGPYVFKGKKSGGPFTYYELDLGDVWRAGPRGANEDSFWP